MKSSFIFLYLKTGEQDKDDVIEANQKMLNDHQKLVLKFQELDISHAAAQEKSNNEIKKMQDEHESQVN